jgi:glycerol-3-phosphate acyltransferase PlsY
MLWVWLPLSYLFGSMPWSVWLGRLLYQVDPRQQPDHNPGAANAFRAAGWRLGALVLVLDFAKACIPVALARWLFDLPAQQLFWIALMPMLGHAFSVFLGFRGGRGIVVLFGVWTGLTLYQAPVVMGIAALAAVRFIKRDEYSALAIPLVLMAYLLVTRAPVWMVVLASVQLLILLIKIAAYVLRPQAPREIEAE